MCEAEAVAENEVSEDISFASNRAPWPLLLCHASLRGASLQWAEYKKQMQVSDDNVAGQLLSCGSKELQTSLQRITGGTLYQKTEADLLDEMKKLVVRYQNPAVYVE